MAVVILTDNFLNLYFFKCCCLQVPSYLLIVKISSDQKDMEDTEFMQNNRRFGTVV